MSKRRKKKIIIIHGGNLIDGTGAKPRKNFVVVVEGAKITVVGRKGEVKIPKNARKTEVDASGKTVMPLCRCVTSSPTSCHFFSLRLTAAAIR